MLGVEHLSTGLRRPDPAWIRARVATLVRVRKESFGALVYVGRRDHFFALDTEHAKVMTALGGQFRPVADAAAVTTLAEIGAVVTEPATAERAFYGRSLIGRFDATPVSNKPFLVNCLVTAHCPLSCRYCHADDLMTNRDTEEGSWLDEVVRVARATPAMVGVVTGGEPLSRPDRAERLINALAREKALVLDTSGVGDFHRMLPLLRRHGVHVRVSLDSAEKDINDGLRPTNRRYLAPGISSYVHAHDTIRKARRHDVACSVQTVVTSRNSTLDDLLRLRDQLVNLSVSTWALHIVVAAGKAAQGPGANLLAATSTLGVLETLVSRSADENVPIDIRVTSTHRVPNSVLLINAKGELTTQNATGGEKTSVRVPRVRVRRFIRNRFLEKIDQRGHASRYLNGTLDRYQGMESLK